MESEYRTRPPKRDMTTSDILAPSPTHSTASRESQEPTDVPMPRGDFMSRGPSLTFNSRSRSRTTFLKSRSTTMVDPTVQCPVCFDVMTTPKILPCLHNICKKCLQNHILSQVRGEIQRDVDPMSFSCPVCKQVTKPPHQGLGCEKWAGQFPTNFFLHAYGMILAVQREEVDCDPCKRRGESTLATWWCRECSEYQCNVCKTVHGGFKIFKNHGVIPVQDIAENPDIAVPKYEPCADHKERIIKFCRDHKSPCCGTCVSTSHRKCDHIVTIEEEFESLKGRNELNDLANILKDYEEMANEAIEFRKRLVEDMETKKQGIIDKVNKIREEFEQNLKTLQDRLLDDFDIFHASEMEQITELTEQCENLGKQISNAVSLVETVQHSGNQTHVITLIGKISRECSKYERDLRDAQAKLQNVDYEFQVDPVIENAIKSANYFGNVKVRRTHQKSENIVAANPFFKGTANEFARVKAWIAGDRGRCGIVGGAYLDDGRMIIADHDNFKVKLFNETGKLLSKLILKSKPSDLTAVGETCFAVTYPSASGFQFIHLKGNVLSEGKYIDTNRIYHCLSCDGDKIYFVSNSGIGICDLEGKELNFLKPKDHGGPTFSSPGHVKASANGIIITVSERDVAYFLSLDGRLVGSYRGPDFKHPLGVDLDNQGNVLICCKKTSNVHLLSQDGQRVRVVLAEKEDIEQPLIIKFQRFSNKFFLSESVTSSRDYLRLYEWT